VKVVEGEGKVVYLQDYSGRPLRQQLLTGGTLELDLSELPAGIYFLTMTGEQTGPVTRRFVIAR
ncbi:MAG: T9SS type A sorting domain-containing protein, partial [Saprospiraceae bacterium]|nr:T9SS type A sorting domain-containing protein [Saprospiraceae bacterium]